MTTSPRFPPSPTPPLPTYRPGGSLPDYILPVGWEEGMDAGQALLEE